MNSFKRKRYKLFLRLYGFISFFVPKKKNFYVFLPIHDPAKFGGNVKSLNLYLKENHPNIKTNYVAIKDSPYEQAEKAGLNPIKGWDLYKKALRAEYIILDAGNEIFAFGKFKLINLWHGSGFKNIGLRDKNQKPSSVHRKYELIVASSSANQEKLNTCFYSDKAVITGLPRNDIFFKDPTIISDLKQRYGLKTFSQIITYAPTFREFKTINPFTDSFWKKLNSFLKSTNQVFVVKKHPWDEFLKIPNNYSHIKDLSQVIEDSQDLLLMTDFLISDYSSILTDFVITNRPVLIYAYDFGEYKRNCRSLYYDLEEILPKPFVDNQNDLLDKIIDHSWQNSEKHKRSYHNFRKMFHYYLDGDSSKRVVEEINKL